jgi:AcrR family transcriptional regulator
VPSTPTSLPSSAAAPGAGARRTSEGARAAKGDRRERAILDSLESLLVEVPLSRLSVGQIAERAGVGRTAFYFYFESREAALTALARRSLEPIWEAGGDWLFGDADASAGLSRGLRGVVDLWCERGHLLAALVEAACLDPAVLALWREQLEEIIAAVARRIERDAARGHTWPGIDAEQTARTLGWMTERYCYMYLPPRAWQRPPDDVHDALLQTWHHAIYRTPR